MTEFPDFFQRQKKVYLGISKKLKMRGLLAKQNILPFTTIFEESAAYTINIAQTKSNLMSCINQFKSSRKHTRILKFFLSIHYDQPVDSGNDFEIMQWLCNSRSMDIFNRTTAETGFFPLCASVNHACIANAYVFYDANKQKYVCVATKSIQKGDEILFNYIQKIYCYKDRRRLLKDQFRFKCRCQLCDSKQHQEESINHLCELRSSLQKSKIVNIKKIRQAIHLLFKNNVYSQFIEMQLYNNVLSNVPFKHHPGIFVDALRMVRILKRRLKHPSYISLQNNMSKYASFFYGSIFSKKYRNKKYYDRKKRLEILKLAYFFLQYLQAKQQRKVRLDILKTTTNLFDTIKNNSKT